jgi:hypothetical protein
MRTPDRSSRGELRGTDTLHRIREHAQHISLVEGVVHPWLLRGGDNPVMALTGLHAAALARIACDLCNAMAHFDANPAIVCEAIEAPLPTHLVMLVREGATSPAHVATQRAVFGARR